MEFLAWLFLSLKGRLRRRLYCILKAHNDLVLFLPQIPVPKSSAMVNFSRLIFNDHISSCKAFQLSVAITAIFHKKALFNCSLLRHPVALFILILHKFLYSYLQKFANLSVPSSPDNKSNTPFLCFVCPSSYFKFCEIQNDTKGQWQPADG